MMLIDVHILLLPGNKSGLRQNDPVLKDVYEQLSVFLRNDRPKLPKFCLTWKRHFIFKLLYLQEFLSNLND